MNTVKSPRGIRAHYDLNPKGKVLFEGYSVIFKIDFEDLVRQTINQGIFSNNFKLIVNNQNYLIPGDLVRRIYGEKIRLREMEKIENMSTKELIRKYPIGDLL